MNTTNQVIPIKKGRPKTGRKPFRVFLSPNVQRAASKLAYSSTDRSLSAMIERLLAEELRRAGTDLYDGPGKPGGNSTTSLMGEAV